MSWEEEYRTKLMDADSAVRSIESGDRLVVGQAISQPPALMHALARRAEAGEIDQVRVYYYHSERHMRESILRYELMGRILPHCMFWQAGERELEKRGLADGGRKVVYYVPNSFSQATRFLTDEVNVDTLLITVSPMDKDGYFTFGTNNDYSSTVARWRLTPRCRVSSDARSSMCRRCMPSSRIMCHCWSTSHAWCNRMSW